MQRSTVMVNICIAFFFSRLRLSERVQGADTVSFPAVAPHSDLALKSDPLSCLLCIPMTLRSNLIWFKAREIYIHIIPVFVKFQARVPTFLSNWLLPFVFTRGGSRSQVWQGGPSSEAMKCFMLIWNKKGLCTIKCCLSACTCRQMCVTYLLHDS